MLSQLHNLSRRLFTLDEYFALEHLPEGKYEFWDGDIVCMRSQQQLERLLLPERSENPMPKEYLEETPHRLHTLEEYFALEGLGEARYEYWDGEIICMSGGSRQHARIGFNLNLLLGNLLDGSRCEGHTADQPIKTPKWPPYRYPDASVSCQEPEFERMHGIDVLLNPTLVIEVLSSASAGLDQGKKKKAYQSLPSVQQYLLISQNEPHLTLYTRIGSKWQRQDYAKMEGSIHLVSINCELALRDIYKNVTFE